MLVNIGPTSTLLAIYLTRHYVHEAPETDIAENWVRGPSIRASAQILWSAPTERCRKKTN